MFPVKDATHKNSLYQRDSFGRLADFTWPISAGFGLNIRITILYTFIIGASYIFLVNTAVNHRGLNLTVSH